MDTDRPLKRGDIIMTFGRLCRQPTSIRGGGGPARARNMGARAARGDILFFVDADVAIHPDAVDQVVAAFRRGPDLTAVFGSYDDAPAAWWAWVSTAAAGQRIGE